MQLNPYKKNIVGPVLLFLGVAAFAVVLSGLIGLGAGVYVLLLVLALGFGLIGAIDYRVCVLAMILMMPLSGSYFFPRKLFGLPGMNPFNLLLVYGFFSYGMAKIFTRRPDAVDINWVKFFWPILLAMAAATYIGSGHVHQIPAFYRLEAPEMFATKFQYVRDIFVKPLLLFAFVWLIAQAVAKSKSVNGWILAVLLGTTFIACLVWFFVAMAGFSFGALSSSSARTFLSPTGMHANEIGVALLPAYAICLFMFRHVKTFWARFGLGIAGVLVLSALLLTFSRAAMLAILIVTFLFVLKLRKPVWILVGLIVMSVAVLFAPQPVKDRVARGFESGSVGSQKDPLTAGRVGNIWIPLLPEVARHPVAGNGISSTMWSHAARNGTLEVGHPHSAYLQLILDFGVLFGGLIAYFLLKVWRLWRAIAKDERRDTVERAFFDGVCAAFIAFLVQAVSGSTFVFEITHAVYLGALGIALGSIAKTPVEGEATKRPAKLKAMPALLHAPKGRAWG